MTCKCGQVARFYCDDCGQGWCGNCVPRGFWTRTSKGSTRERWGQCQVCIARERRAELDTGIR